jgi:hypothetical protein
VFGPSYEFACTTPLFYPVSALCSALSALLYGKTFNWKLENGECSFLLTPGFLMATRASIDLCAVLIFMIRVRNVLLLTA